MVMEERRMKLRGENEGKGAPTGIEDRISSGAAHPWCAALKGERVNESGMKLWRSYSRSRRGLRSAERKGSMQR